MKNRAISTLLFLLAAGPLRAADRMVAGQWQFTMTTEGSPHDATHCVSPAEAGGVNGDSDRTDAVVGAQLLGAIAGAVTIASQKRDVGSIFGELLGGGETHPGGPADENEVAPRHA